MEGSLKKGKEINNAGDFLKQSLNTVSDISNLGKITPQKVLNTVLGFASGAKETISDKDKDTLSKVLGISNSAVSKAIDMSGASGKELSDAVFPLVGAIDKNADKKVKNIRETINKPAQEMQEDFARDLQNYNGLQQTLAQGINAATNMAPALATAAITKNPNLSMAIMANNVKGQATEEALRQGKSLEEAREIGNTKAGAEVLTELMTGGLNIFGKGALDDVAEQTLNKVVKNPTANFIANKALGIAGENLEESASNILGKAIDKGTVDPNAKLTMKDITEPWGATTVSSLLLNGLSGGYTPKAYRDYTSQMKVQNLNDVERTALTEITNKRLAGQQLDDNDIATINYLNNKDSIQNIEQAQPNEEVIQPTEEINQQNIEAEEINKPIEQKTQEAKTEENASKEKQDAPMQETTQTVEEKPIRRIENRDYSSEKYKNLSDEDLQMLDSLYMKNKNGEQFTDEDNINMEYLKKKASGIKNPELKTNNTFEDLKSDYGKYYKNNNLDNFDSEYLNKAEEIIQGNKQGRRTKQEWLDIAENIGQQAENMDSESLKRYAFESFKYAAPNQKGNLNRQGQKYVNFGIDEWVNKVYEGAGVGKKIENNNIAALKEQEPVIKVETTGEKGKQYWKEQGTSDEVAKVLSEMPKVEKESIREKIKKGKASLEEQWSYFKRNLVDKGETIYKLGKKTKNPNLYAKYDKRGTTTGEANYDIGVAQTNLEGKKFENFTNKDGKKTSMSLNEIWEGVDPQVANEYLAHYLNVDRYNQINQDGTQKYVFGESITDKDSLQKVKELESQHPELKRFGENVWQYGKNQLQNMVDAGKISQAQADNFLNETPHYVRLQRNVEKTSSPLLEFDKKGNVKVNKNIKEFKGSTLDILPFKDSMAQYTLDVRNSIRDNIFAQELAKTLGVGVDGDTVTDIEDIFGTNEELLKDNGDGTYSLTFFNKGTATTIPINEGIYESLQPNKHYKFEETIPFKGIRKFDNFRKALLTDKNPMFLATNMMKDAFDAPLNSKYPASFVKNYPRAIKQIMTNGKYYQQYQALGGLQNTYFDKEGFQKQGSKANPMTWIEKGNNAIEQIPRLAEFISTMKKTGDIDQAMYNAAEITTNFKRGGNVSKAANRNGATFLNASIQGFSKQVRNFTDIQSPKQAAQLLGKIVVLGIAPALINDLMWDDDEEYKDMQDYQKDRYYLFKGKDGQWIRIPKGRAVSIFQSAARRTKYALKGEKNTFNEFGTFASGQVAPNNPFENNIISPFIDVARNKSWSGNDIVSDSIANKKHPEEEYTIKTDEFSKWLGKKTNQSPAKINYLIDQYSGAIGDVVLPNITKKATSRSDNIASNMFLNPIKDKFTTNAITSSKNQNDFYNALSEAEDDKNWSKSTPKDEAVYKYLYNKNKEISDIRKKSIEVQESDISNKEKYDKVMEYQKQINKISKEAVKESKNIKQPSKNEMIIGGKHYTIQDGKVNAIKDETVDKANEYGLSVGNYIDVTSHYGTIKADKDENGNTIAGSKKQKFIDYVNAKNELTNQQKIAIIQKYYKKYNGE